jgi:hypothetical protein
MREVEENRAMNAAPVLRLITVHQPAAAHLRDAEFIDMPISACTIGQTEAHARVGIELRK